MYQLMVLLQVIPLCDLIQFSSCRLQKYQPIIDGAKGEALSETYNKNLKRVLKLPEPKEEELDKTLLV